MITIIHGDNTAQSREYYFNEKKKVKTPVEYLGKELDISLLAQALEGESLFSEQKNIFIDTLLTSKKSSNQKEIIEYLNMHHKDHEIFIWENTELKKTSLTLFKDANAKIFKLSQNLFSFLDSIIPASKNNLSFFHNALANTNEELLFYMLTRQFRLMLAVTSSGKMIDEAKRLMPWQKSKIEKQAKLFGKDKLISAIKKLHEIDFMQKTGGANMSLIQSVDIFLLTV